MFLDVANPDVKDYSGTISIVVCIAAVLVLVCLIGLIVYLIKKGKKTNEKK